VVKIADEGDYTVDEPVCVLALTGGMETTITMSQKWPIRIPRPVSERLPLKRPLITGLRVIDTLFPLAKGGTVAIPGGSVRERR
jgi:V/A-type H+-transporting ATPase subunit A